MKKYQIVYEVVKQYLVEIEAESEREAREKLDEGKYDVESVQDMEDIAPYEDWDNKNIVDVQEVE